MSRNPYSLIREKRRTLISAQIINISGKFLLQQWLLPVGLVGSQFVLVFGYGCHFTELHNSVAHVFILSGSILTETIYLANILSDSWLFRRIISSVTQGRFSGLCPQWLRTLAGFCPQWLRSLFRRVISSVTKDSVPPGYIFSDSGLRSTGLYPQWLKTLFRRAKSSVAQDFLPPGNALGGSWFWFTG
jgi:hypothetical protein